MTSNLVRKTQDTFDQIKSQLNKKMPTSAKTKDLFNRITGAKEKKAEEYMLFIEGGAYLNKLSLRNTAIIPHASITLKLQSLAFMWDIHYGKQRPIRSILSGTVQDAHGVLEATSFYIGMCTNKPFTIKIHKLAIHNIRAHMYIGICIQGVNTIIHNRLNHTTLQTNIDTQLSVAIKFYGQINTWLRPCIMIYIHDRSITLSVALSINSRLLTK